MRGRGFWSAAVAAAIAASVPTLSIAATFAATAVTAAVAAAVATAAIATAAFAAAISAAIAAAISSPASSSFSPAVAATSASSFPATCPTPVLPTPMRPGMDGRRGRLEQRVLLDDTWLRLSCSSLRGCTIVHCDDCGAADGVSQRDGARRQWQLH